MKKQVTTLAVMMLASNVAMANLSTQSLKMSAESINSIVQAGEVLAAGSSQFSINGKNLTADALRGTLAIAGTSAQSTSNAVGDAAEFAGDKAVSASKGVGAIASKSGEVISKGAKSASDKAVSAASASKDVAVKSAKSTSEGISEAAEFTVEKVGSAVSGSVKVITVVLKGAKDGVVMVGTFSYNTAKPVGQAMVDSAQFLFREGKNVIVATSTGGVVLVTEGAQGLGNVLEGSIKSGSNTIVTSVDSTSNASGKASKAFSSKLVK